MGIQCKQEYLFSDKYLSFKYSGNPAFIWEALKGYLKRIFSFFSIHNYEVMVVEKELFPYLPFFFDNLFFKKGIPSILDYDDAIFHNYDQHRSVLIKILLRDKIQKVMRLATVVSTCSEYIVRYARNAGAKKIIQIPTVVDLTKYCEKKYCDSKVNQVVIGWIGSPSTSRYLISVKKALEKVARSYPISLVIVGAENQFIPEFEGISAKIVNWSEETEVDLIRSFDIGIMPLSHDQWSKGKCGFKLIQYMACGIPPVASPVGQNNKIIDHGITGFLAESTEEWIQALNELISNPNLRQTMGAKGRKKVEQNYSLDIIQPKYLHLIQGVLNNVGNGITKN